MAVHDSENHRLIVFGGRTGERKRLNDVYFLDLDTFVWYKPVTEGTSPTPREQAVGCFWAGSMIVFGEQQKQPWFAFIIFGALFRGSCDQVKI